MDPNNKENYSNKRVESKHRIFLQPFEIYGVCDILKTELGNALVDTRSQVSLVKEHSVIK